MEKIKSKISPDTERIKITLRWFSVLADHRGLREEQFTHQGNLTVGDLIQKLSENFPILNEFKPYLRTAVNRDYVGFETRLADGDEVAFITPVSGG